MRCNLFGMQFQGDHVSCRVSLRVVGPSGKIVFDKANYASIDTFVPYHPPSLWIPVHGTLAVPNGLEKGLYREEFTIIDSISNREIRQKGSFEVR